MDRWLDRWMERKEQYSLDCYSNDNKFHCRDQDWKRFQEELNCYSNEALLIHRERESVLNDLSPVNGGGRKGGERQEI